jgi:hypothetical protein
LDAYLFEDLNQIRGITDEWIAVYNEEAPIGKVASQTIQTTGKTLYIFDVCFMGETMPLKYILVKYL